MNKKTHFGFQEVDAREKPGLVRQVFDSVAPSYDRMNDILSCGVHRLWKHYAVESSGVQKGDVVLDVAGGSGDMAAAFAKKIGGECVILTDINAAMLAEGREKMINQGTTGVRFVEADAENLGFADNIFDCVSIAFGLRNITDQNAALSEMHRVLKIGGTLIILEFSKVRSEILREIYDFYSFKMMPALGRIFADDAESYRYLAESIRKHPDQETLKSMVLQSGFGFCEYQNLSGGIVALHKAVKTR